MARVSFDYRIQVWVVDGIVQRCGHPASMRPGGEPCCNAYYYAGRPIAEVPGSERAVAYWLTRKRWRTRRHEAYDNG